MAEANKSTTGTGNTAVPNQGDHDRIAMLSLKADGTPDQHNPEIIIDKDQAKAATVQQFTEQAVSAADVARTDARANTGVEQLEQDPSIAEVQREHEAVAQAAEKAADKAVEALHTGDQDTGRQARVQAASKSPADRAEKR